VVRTDSLGQTYSPTGQQWFIGVNSTLLANQVPILLLPPIISSPGTPSITAIAISDLAATITCTAGGPLARLEIWASPPLSQGVSFNKDFRLLKTVPYTTSTPVSFGQEYFDRFGLPPVGSKVIMQVFYQVEGQKGPQSQIAATVA
jgi:hypothetical protein